MQVPYPIPDINLEENIEYAKYLIEIKNLPLEVIGKGNNGAMFIKD